MKPFWTLTVSTVAWLATAPAGWAEPAEPPPGEEKSATTRVLESGAALLQGNTPLQKMDIHLVGIHPMKAEPAHQMDVHHFCRQANEDFAQCALFDGSDESANLTGIEYIISEALFDQLPAEEKKYWHPHNYEILSGTLVAPNIPAAAEHQLMKGKINSYGKTWHTWSARGANRQPDKLPLGEPELAWSLNRDGEADPALLEQREKALGMSMEEIRKNRMDLVPLTRPQSGVDDLKGRFPRETRPLKGVEAAPAGR